MADEDRKIRSSQAEESKSKGPRAAHGPQESRTHGSATPRDAGFGPESLESGLPPTVTEELAKQIIGALVDHPATAPRDRFFVIDLMGEIYGTDFHGTKRDLLEGVIVRNKMFVEIIDNSVKLRLREKEDEEYWAKPPLERLLVEANVAGITQAIKSSVAKSSVVVPPNVIVQSQQDTVIGRTEFEKIVAIALPNLSDNERHALIEDALNRDAEALKKKQFFERSRAAPHRPMKWADKPASMKLVEFLEHEYRDKGLLTPDFNRKSLAEIDPELVGAIASYTRYKSLPPDVDIPKARNRKNEREKAGLEHMPNPHRTK